MVPPAVRIAAKRRRLERLIDERRAEEAERAELAAVVSDVLRGNGELDAANDKHRRAVDDHFAQVVAPALTGRPPEQLIDASVDYIGRTGLVPKPIKERVRGALKGTDADNKVVAADFLTPR